MMISSRITQVLKIMQKVSSQDNELATKTSKSPTSWLNFGNDNEYELSMANDRPSKEKAYQLVYKSYIEKEYTQEHRSNMWYSIYDAHPDTTTFIVKKCDRVVGAITVVFDSLLGLPCEELFIKEVDQLRNKPKYIAEVVSLAVDEKERGATIILTKLFNTVIRYSQRIKGATDFLITVNPRHSFFYKKKLLFSELSTASSYDKVGGAPAVLLNLDLIAAQRITKFKQLKKYKRTLYPNFISYDLESEIFEHLKSMQASINESDFIYFFKQHRSSFSKASAKEKKYISEFYPYLKHSRLSLFNPIKKYVS